MVFHHQLERAHHVATLETILKRDNFLHLVAVKFHVAGTECLGYLVHGHPVRLDNGGDQIVFRVIPHPDAIFHILMNRGERHGRNHGEHGDVRVEILGGFDGVFD